MIVVDASVVVPWIVQAPTSAAARRVLEEGDAVIVPSLLLAEVANVLWKLSVFAGLPAESARGALTRLPMLLPDVVDDAEVVNPALALAIELGHPVYDCVYLALAEREGCRLVTFDGKLARRVATTRLAERVELLA